jgi:hypothetical protein
MIKIQISNPRLLGIKDDNDSNIEDAIETIFPSNTEYAFLIWNNIFIPLSYKYDISKMINDFIFLEKFIDSNEEEINIYWASNTFSSIWKLQKKQNMIKIQSKWNCVLGSLIDLLNTKSEIVVDSKQLNMELYKMLKFIKLSLDKCNYNNKLIDYFELENLVGNVSD